MQPEKDLERLFAEYREACGTPEASPDFLGGIWRRIEQRCGFWFCFEHLARLVTAFAAVVCVVLFLLNVSARHVAQQPAVTAATYADALAADQTSEATLYGYGVSGPQTDQQR